MSNEAKAIFQSIANSDEFVETTALFDYGPTKQ